MGSWFCICHQYSGCQLIKDFVKCQKRYCCICQFQDRFDLWELNDIKREVKKLKNYYMEIMTAVCEIKKVTMCKENFWERDIHYVIKNDGIHTYFKEMKNFLFQLHSSTKKNFFLVSKILELMLANLNVLISKIILILPG